MPLRFEQQTVDRVIVVGRVVVEQHRLCDARGAARVDRVLDRAVTPPDASGVLLGRVLGVVDHDVGALQERDMAIIIAVRSHVATHTEGAIERLVVGDVAHGGAVALQSIRKRERRVVEVLRAHHHVVDVEHALDELVVADPASELIDRDGEVRIAHLCGKRLAKRFVHATRAVNAPLARAVERGEERQSLDVVPMRMAEQKRTRRRFPVGRSKNVRPEQTGPGATVEHDAGAASGAHLHARRVAAVTHSRRPRSCDRTPGAPEADQHEPQLAGSLPRLSSWSSLGIRHLSSPTLKVPTWPWNVCELSIGHDPDMGPSSLWQVLQTCSASSGKCREQREGRPERRITTSSSWLLPLSSR